MPDILEHLIFLYGLETATAVEPRLQALVQQHRREPQQPRPQRRGPRTLPLSQRDAILITYGDQVRVEGEAPLATLAGFAEAHAADVVSGIHVLPFYPYSSDDGFSVIDYRVVDPALGDWQDIRRLGTRFDLMFDAVFNHCSAESEWFRRFLAGDAACRDWFITVDGDPDLSQVVRPRALPLLTTFQTAAGPRRVWTTFSEDQVDLNLKSPEVLLALIDVLLFYVAQGARLIRLDAIAYLWKEIGTTCIHLPQTHRVIQLMRSVLDAVDPDVLLITETNVPHRDNVSYFGDGGNEAQLVYNFALPPLVLHALATGNGEALTRWAGSLEVPSAGVTFFNFLASHDGIGINPARGILSQEEIAGLVERVEAHGGFVSYKSNPDGSQSPYELNINYFDALSNPAAGEPPGIPVARFMVAHAIQLAMAGVPGIYFHSLFGSRGDRRAAEETGIKRRVNREKLSLADLEHDLADPSTRRSQVLGGFQRLMAARRSSAAFDPSGRQQVLTIDPRVFALLRVSPQGDAAAVCLHNLAAEPVRIDAGLDASVRELTERQGLLVGGRLRADLGPYEVRWKLGGARPMEESLPARAAI